MKRRHILFINIMFVGLILFSAGVVYQFMTGVRVLAILDTAHKSPPPIVDTNHCTDEKPLSLTDVTSPSLMRLASYQQACHSFVTDTVMVFMSMPTTRDEAVQYADEDAKTLQDFARHNVRPLVIAEPTEKSGEKLDFSLAAAGAYKDATDVYFQTLKAKGLTDAQLGIWTPYPEANLPYWLNNKPEYFAPAVNTYVASLHALFPQAATSVMLNSATYDTTDFDWANGDYSSLLPYIRGITPGTITYAGLQGFPWTSRDGSASILNAAEFLNPELLTEMADSLGTKKVWFNTGTFSAKYTLGSEHQITMTPERRRAILATITNQAQIIQRKGYDVSVNIFAQDKSKMAEETNWSYWDQNPFTSQHSPVITQFIRDSTQQKVNFWLFDN